MTKHKKLKRKYQTLQNDIYADEDEISVPQTIKEPEPEVKNEVHEEVKKDYVRGSESLEVKNEPSMQQQMQQQVYNKRMNWRTRLSYL